MKKSKHLLFQEQQEQISRDTMNKKQISRIMIFGRPGSGKSSFAWELAKKTGLPLYHLDKYFFVNNWVERNYQEFLAIQHSIVEKDHWIIDGNSRRSLEMRYSKVDIALYLNYNKWLCLYRLFKRLFYKNPKIDDRAENCLEVIRWKLIKYMWSYEKLIDKDLERLRHKYPNVELIEVNSNRQLDKIRERLYNI